MFLQTFAIETNDDAPACQGGRYRTAAPDDSAGYAQVRRHPVRGVRPVPRRNVRTAVVAVLQHQQLDIAPGFLHQTFGVLPGDEAILAPEDDQERNRDPGGMTDQGQCAREPLSLSVVTGARAHLEGPAGQFRQLLPAAVSYTHLRAHETRHDLV